MKVDKALRRELWDRYSFDNASLTPYAVKKLKEFYNLILRGEELIIENTDGSKLIITTKEDYLNWLNDEYDPDFSKLIAS